MTGKLARKSCQDTVIGKVVGGWIVEESSFTVSRPQNGNHSTLARLRVLKLLPFPSVRTSNNDPRVCTTFCVAVQLLHLLPCTTRMNYTSDKTELAGKKVVLASRRGRRGVGTLASS